MPSKHDLQQPYYKNNLNLNYIIHDPNSNQDYSILSILDEVLNLMIRNHYPISPEYVIFKNNLKDGYDRTNDINHNQAVVIMAFKNYLKSPTSYMGHYFKSIYLPLTNENNLPVILDDNRVTDMNGFPIMHPIINSIITTLSKMAKSNQPQYLSKRYVYQKVHDYMDLCWYNYNNYNSKSFNKDEDIR